MQYFMFVFLKYTYMHTYIHVYMWYIYIFLSLSWKRGHQRCWVGDCLKNCILWTILFDNTWFLKTHIIIMSLEVQWWSDFQIQMNATQPFFSGLEGNRWWDTKMNKNSTPWWERCWGPHRGSPSPRAASQFLVIFASFDEGGSGCHKGHSRLRSLEDYVE